MKALAPGFLIAMPQLLDPHFQRTVVLMIEHSDSGSLGLVVNRPAPMTLEELGRRQSLAVSKQRNDERIFLGGPVEPYRGFVLHDVEGLEDAVSLLPGLSLSTNAEVLNKLLTDPGPRMRFCLGYAGWGPGQVEKELTQGSWLFTEAKAVDVLDVAPEQVWESVIKAMGLDPAMLVTTGGIN